MRLASLIAACLGFLSVWACANAADGTFAPRIIVNDSVISNFELNQRLAFLKALNSAGDLEKIALDGLIEDRLRLQAAKAEKIKLTADDVSKGLTEFASRANLTAEQFTQELGKSGVEPETFRDFVTAGLAWREVVRNRFASRIVISDGEIERARSVTKQRGGVRVLLSELIIPAQPGQEADAMAQAEELRASIRTEADFAAAAQQFSASPSAQQGGRIDGIDLGNLPPALRDLVIVLRPGEVTPPVPIPNAVGLFQLRALQETGRPATEATELDYMQVLLPETAGTGAEIARLRAGSDRCDDLFGLTKGLPAEQVTRKTEAAGAVPRDIALELARLDAGESSVALRRGNARVFLMLCARNVALTGDKPPPTKDELRAQLLNQRLAAAADGYLMNLRAAAVIREP